MSTDLMPTTESIILCTTKVWADKNRFERSSKSMVPTKRALVVASIIVTFALSQKGHYIQQKKVTHSKASDETRIKKNLQAESSNLTPVNFNCNYVPQLNSRHRRSMTILYDNLRRCTINLNINTPK